ncbi:MAG: cation transporter [Gammaproteobacteria bacterium]|nr:MAG: cation transporter [Gammaproteobacteria bacterium]RLA35663.1 MAG: cation transporter [Gammaproteobacteria bacterium]
MAGSSKKAIYAALFGNALIAVTKFAAASYTGSAAMMSEGIHSLVDTGNQVLLLYGIKRASRPASAEFPFGHGKEIYFWSFVVAMLIFALGGTVSIYKGWQHLAHPAEISSLTINYVVLGLALVFEGAALWVAFKEFNRSRGSRSIIEAIRRGKDPTLFVVVFEDSAALLGLLIALVGLILYQLTGNLIFDGLASILIGVVLILTAIALAIESKNLLIGESADPRIVAEIHETVAADSSVLSVNEVATLHMGPEFIVATLSIDFVDSMSAEELEATVTQLNGRIKAIDNRLQRVFIEAERKEDHNSQNHRSE